MYCFFYFQVGNNFKKTKESVANEDGQNIDFCDNANNNIAEKDNHGEEQLDESSPILISFEQTEAFPSDSMYYWFFFRFKKKKKKFLILCYYK